MPLADTHIIQDSARLQALHALCLLDTPADSAFDRLTELAALVINVPMALVTLIDADRQFVKTQVGLADPWKTTRQMPLSHSFCQHVVARAEPLIIDDAREHPLVHDNASIVDLNIIAYAGIPIITSSGHAIGSFCVIDHTPRHWTEKEITLLKKLAASVSTEIELRAEINERLHIEKVLIEREHFINQIVNTSPGAIYVYHLLEERMVYMSSGSEPVLGYSAEDMQAMGSSLFKRLIHPDDMAVLDERSRQFGSSQSDESFSFEYRIQQSDESYRWVRSSETAFTRSESGDVIEVIGVAQDITKDKMADEEREKLLVRITDLEHLKSDMIRVAAHDLRAPLSIIIGYAALLKDDVLTETQDTFMNEIAKAARRMENMIRDILSLERIEAHAAGQHESVVLNTLVQTAYNEGYLQADHKSQAYVLSLPDTPVVVQGDPVQLKEAVDNLIRNAIKYTHESGTIQVRLTANGIFEVEDSGYGIPENQQHGLFSPFFRASSPETREIEGTGLGLHLVKRIIERHGGQMHFHSEYGKGSIFGFRLDPESNPHAGQSRQIVIQ